MRRAFLILVLTALSVFTIPGSAFCDLTCASVNIEILQKMTSERVAFDANLKITNGMSTTAIENVNVVLSIKESTGADQTALFYVGTPDCTPTGYNVSGTGVAQPGTVSTAHWLIIPSPGAGGTAPEGKTYYVGAHMTYTIEGQQIDLPIYPCSIQVLPEPQLYLDYFAPYKVLGDNPTTSEVESPVPYDFLIRVLNDGYATAKLG